MAFIEFLLKKKNIQILLDVSEHKLEPRREYRISLNLGKVEFVKEM